MEKYYKHKIKNKSKSSSKMMNNLKGRRSNRCQNMFKLHLHYKTLMKINNNKYNNSNKISRYNKKKQKIKKTLKSKKKQKKMKKKIINLQICQKEMC